MISRATCFLVAVVFIFIVQISSMVTVFISKKWNSENSASKPIPTFTFPARDLRPVLWEPDQPVAKEILDAYPKCQSEQWCDSMYPLNETLLFQRTLYEHQHPSDCSKARYLIMDDEWPSGFGSMVHIKAFLLSIALDDNRVLIESPQQVFPYTWSKHCPRRQWSCYFLPVTHCTLPVDYRARAVPFNFNLTAQFTYIIATPGHQHAGYTSFIPSFAKWNQVNPRNPNKPLSWWVAQLSKYLLRPNNQTISQWIFPEFMQIFPLGIIPHPLAAVFIRGGDKFKEAKLLPPSAYFKLLEPVADRFGIKHVYLGSDSEQVIEQALEEYGHKYVFHVMQAPRQEAGLVFERVAETWNSRYTVRQMRHSLADLYVSTLADVFVGTLSSNWCRLVDELRKTMGKGRVHYLTPEKTGTEKQIW